MEKTNFESVSSLVLVDILAALPMEHVVRMARLGHERLRLTCSLKWVADRMTDVNFETIVDVRRPVCRTVVEKLRRACSLKWLIDQRKTNVNFGIGNDVVTLFCAESTMKRLKGIIAVTNFYFNDTNCDNTCVELVKQIPGNLLLCMRMCPKYFDWKELKRHAKFLTDMASLTNLTYVIAIEEDIFDPSIIDRSPKVLFEYKICNDERLQYVFYRPTLLNGRHIVDVLRVVCGPRDIDEEELEHIKKKATENVDAYTVGPEGFGGLLSTWWTGPVVTLTHINPTRF